MVSTTADFTKYDTVTIYDSKYASHIELELEMIFEELGYNVVGEAEAKPGTMGVRYNGVWPSYTYFKATLLLEDAITDKTLASFEANKQDWTGRSNTESGAWKRIKEELKTVLKK
jgi:hypothetical protein